MPLHTQSPPQHKPNSIIISILIKPLIMLLILSVFLFLGIAAVSTVLLLLAASSLHFSPRRHHDNRRRRAESTLPVEQLQYYLPQFKYEGKVELSRDCAVCLECFGKGEWCRRLRDCNHVFHVKCVDSWLTKVLNCPVCRSPVCFDPRALSSVIRECEIDEYKLWCTIAY